MLLVATWPNQASAFALFAPILALAWIAQLAGAVAQAVVAVARLVAAVARLVHLIELVQPAGALALAVVASDASAALARAVAAVAQARAVVELEQLARVAVAPKCAAFQLNLANRR